METLWSTWEEKQRLNVNPVRTSAAGTSAGEGGSPGDNSTDAGDGCKPGHTNQHRRQFLLSSSRTPNPSGSPVHSSFRCSPNWRTPHHLGWQNSKGTHCACLSSGPKEAPNGLVSALVLHAVARTILFTLNPNGSPVLVWDRSNSPWWLGLLQRHQSGPFLTLKRTQHLATSVSSNTLLLLLTDLHLTGTLTDGANRSCIPCLQELTQTKTSKKPPTESCYIKYALCSYHGKSFLMTKWKSLC